jgi:hypothetical protein
MAVEFLSGSDVLAKLSRVLKDSGGADLAVAFWGTKATETLGIGSASGPVRVLCDAYSGACNPGELAKLLRMKVHLRTWNGLHAKVYLTAESVAVGSANASANGLGEEGTEARNVEAMVLTNDPKCLESARSWFASIWADARDVTPAMIEEIRPIWQNRRIVRPNGVAPSSSLLGVLNADPDWFRDRGIRLIAYEGTGVSPEAEAVFKVIGSRLYHPKALQRYNSTREIPYYEDNGGWEVLPGEYIVDYDIDRKSGRAIWGGLWRVRSFDAFHKVGRRSRIILLDKAQDFNGLQMNTADGKRLGRAVFKHAASKDFRPDQNGNILDVSFDRTLEILSLEQ